MDYSSGLWGDSEFLCFYEKWETIYPTLYLLYLDPEIPSSTHSNALQSVPIPQKSCFYKPHPMP